ncbi:MULTISPECIES: thiolase family protein [Sphingobium]|jgi:acetyl-CoA acetyltransferase|uniref:thiolase family protein n=1 Tax=Sphingobium TaxID=165695 RepID=UPI000C51DF79|nr:MULTISPECIES: thiolase family protein [Sphingobium]MBS48914.1 DitF protein [Sphingobium sp.]MCC4256237.1 thiolase family protein [Sphingobium lactosutens]HCW62061.1 DitF protein [Sphingobium sp.]|tara:strand:+ start:1742 stop:2929 length:1188 start_codon:yes stop_codon:yes gene_type:complete
MTAYAEKQTAITGIGQSKISRGADKSALGLTIDAALGAIADAGLTRAHIDGMATWPGDRADGSGFSDVGIPALQDALRLKLGWYSNAAETSGQFGALFNAIGAIASGLCRHILIFRTMYEATARKAGFANALNRPGDRVRGPFAWYAPYHTYAAATQQALMFQRYVHESGIKPAQVAQIAINGRRNASRNPAAIYRTPIDMDDYFASPIISTPLRLFDCDVPIDGSTAIILSHIDAARDGPHPVTHIEAIGSSMQYRNSWTQLDALATQAQPKVAQMMWNRTDLKPADVDVAELYDGFSFHTINWLENFGFCGRYEAGDLIGDGSRIALEGDLPINTNGGALSAGRMHAYGQVHEACVQLRGLGGDRQVNGTPRVAALSTAGGPLAACFLLVRAN